MAIDKTEKRGDTSSLRKGRPRIVMYSSWNAFHGSAFLTAFVAIPPWTWWNVPSPRRVIS